METLYCTEYVAGTAVCTATGTEAISFTESLSGTVANIGTPAESISFSEYTTGYPATLGVAEERISFSEFCTATTTVVGVSAETIRFSESNSVILNGFAAESIAFSEAASGVSTVTGTAAESIAFSEYLQSNLVQTTTDNIWCVNLFNGGHSRYEGDITGVTEVTAYAITGVMDFGIPQQKFIHDLYLYMRADGDIAIDTTTDEQVFVEGVPICYDDRPGVHRRRDRRPRGIKGSAWQFKIYNIDQSDFEIKQMEFDPIPSLRLAR